MATVSTYTTDSIYATVPDFIRAQDAQNGNALYKLLESVGSQLDAEVNIPARDNMGAGVSGMGADGTIDTANYGGAPGWSQMVDIDRCPAYALPWLAQFLGVRLASTPSTPGERIAAVEKISTRSLFQRGTPASIVNILVASINGSLPPSGIPLSSDQIIVMENTCYTSGVYSQNDYAVVILIPGLYFSLFTYASLQNKEGLTATYATTEAYVKSLSAGNSYSGLAGSFAPSLLSSYTNIIYKYRPAGLQVYIGGY